MEEREGGRERGRDGGGRKGKNKGRKKVLREEGMGRKGGK